MNNQNQEIDLITLFIKIYLFFSRKIVFFLIFIILGAALGFTKSYFSKEYFETIYITNLDIIEDDIVYEMSISLQNNLEDNNSEYLATSLNLNPESIDLIKDITIDTSGNRTIIKAELFDKSYNDSLKIGLIYYFSNNDYINNTLTENKTFIKQKIKKIEEEVTEIDSIQKNILNYSTTVNRPLFMDKSKDYSTHIDILNLYNEKLELEKDITHNTSIKVLYTPRRPNNAKDSLLLEVIIYSMVSFLIAVFIAIFISIRKRVKEYVITEEL